jgi:hypothetical protein
MANAAQTPKLQLGKLSPEDAERLASTFRPIWELDDAPFAQGSALSAADIDALAGGAGVSPSIRGTQQSQEAKTEVTIPRPSVPGHVPAPDAPKVEIAVELDTEDLVTATPAPVEPPVAQARPQQPAPASVAATVRKPYTPPRAPPQSINMRDADASNEFAPVKKSNTGIIIGAVAVVVIIGGIFGVKAMMGGDKAQGGDKASTSQTNHEEGTHIPPPPEVAATQEATAAPTQTAAPVVTAKATTNDSPIVKEFPGSNTAPPATTHANTTAAVHQTTHAAGGGGTTTHAAAGGGGSKPAGKPAIVRDNPF